ncbi:MAG: hypothetical protein AAF360_10745 [Pseudomonadota bacterium]
MDVIPLSKALTIVAGELEDLRVASLALQDVVSDLLADRPALSANAMGAVQRLDRMSQELTDLGPFMAEMALYAEQHGHPDVSTATELVHLDSLRARLQGAGADDGEVVAGEPELF